MSDTICLFSKPPVAGVVKTRLAPRLGDDGAAQLARAFLLDSLATMESVEWAKTMVATTQEMPADLGIDPERCWLQGDGDLGERLERIMTRALTSAERVYAVGADSPTLPATRLADAKLALRDYDAVLGPSHDGGYYLIALKECTPGLLADLPWSSPKTLSATMNRLTERGMKVALLEPWFDVDRPEDLPRLWKSCAQGGAPHTLETLAQLTLAKRKQK